ncbi:MAG: type II toxin-antitoxin system prevent-host-death family antitoxin [Planctomycetota bacterium]|jgi:prevent-host-death family protein|nr:type II toxin-antitoxin system prevent-host-death family antitoxin [Planctomycetota bacterium]MDP7131644.1 type II toxin-antitoxin system prevent-host-death family antitoxin [Planctomycetota bacterium]MDP7251558.1 type II toxin-antitoxin system prevent-host-death family antitoxin [Planctomycetota bacterium]
MKFVTVRELRGSSAQIWKRLESEGDLVVTSNGKPVAILSPVSDENVEESIRSIRRARAENAVMALQLDSIEAGKDKLRPSEIDSEIASVRKKRRR